MTKLTPSQIRRMNDLGGYPVINRAPNPMPFHVYVNGKERYSMTTGKKSMTWDDADRNRKMIERLDPSARVQITRVD
jgi:hypothetical protein